MSNRVIDYGTDGKAFTLQGNGTETFIVPLIHNAAPDAISGAGAISVTTYYTAATSTSTDAWTLANGTVKGQLKKVQMIVDGGTSTLTLASAISSALDVITFADAGDFALLMWTGSAWRILELGNDADGATAPAVA